MAEGTRMLQRRGLAAEWDLSEYVLSAGEIGVAVDTGGFKVGDGVNIWSELPNPYDSAYLPLAGTAANSALLGGISASGFLQTGDGDVDGNPNTIALRTAEGKLKAAAATTGTEVINWSQMVQQLLDNKKEIFIRTLADATTDITLQVADVNGMMLVTNNSSTTVRNVIVPTNATVAVPVGAWIDVCNQGSGLLKITTAGGVILRGSQNIFSFSSVVRLLKTATDEWIAIALSNPRQGRLPKIRIYRSIGTNYLASTYQAVPFDQIDTAQTFNPSNEYFSIDPVGMIASRRVIINKTGEYQCVANFSKDGGGVSYIKVCKMTGNNVQGAHLSNGNGVLILNTSWTGRVTAGESLGVAVYQQGATFNDNPDSATAGGNRNDFTITKIGD